MLSRNAQMPLFSLRQCETDLNKFPFNIDDIEIKLFKITVIMRQKHLWSLTSRYGKLKTS